MRHYIIESADGDWNIVTSTPFKELTGRAPKVREGTVIINKKMYTIDPSRFRRLAYRPKRFLWLIKEYAQVGLWKDNDPEQLDFFSLEGTSPPITGTVMAALSRSERLRRLVAPQTDWMVIVVVVMAMALVAMGAAVYFLANKGGVP